MYQTTIIYCMTWSHSGREKDSKERSMVGSQAAICCYFIFHFNFPDAK